MKENERRRNYNADNIKAARDREKTIIQHTIEINTDKNKNTTTNHCNTLQHHHHFQQTNTTQEVRISHQRSNTWTLNLNPGQYSLSSLSLPRPPPALDFLTWVAWESQEDYSRADQCRHFWTPPETLNENVKRERHMTQARGGKENIKTVNSFLPGLNFFLNA